MMLHLISIEICLAHFSDTVIFKTFEKIHSFEYNSDSALFLNVYVMSNGYFHFGNYAKEEPHGWIFQNKKVIPYRETIVKSDTAIKKIPNYFLNGLRADCPGCDLGHAYRLNMFSELPIHRALEENMIRISYVSRYGRLSDKTTTYHMIKVLFRNDTTIMQYKEGTFVEGEFCCYINDEIFLSKKEVERVLKFDTKISWELEPYDCISDADKNGVVERKKGNFFFSCVRNGYCTNIEKKSLSYMIRFIGEVLSIRDKRIINNIDDQFPH